MKRMIKQISCMLLATTLTTFAMAQNNAIFKGGNADGWVTQNFAQASTSIFKGGFADGWASQNFAQASTSIYKGGSGDGWDSKNYLQTRLYIYSGGIGDGWSSNYRPQGPLPVTWGDFTAVKYNENASLLTWITLQEFNSAKFEIERSADAVSFVKIGEKAASGNSQVSITYTYTDISPLKAENFYRIKQIDKDGRFTYSPTRMVKFDAISRSEFVKVYPNPATGPLHIELPSSMQNQQLVINIIAANGTVVNQLKVYNLSGRIITTDMSHYARGTYIIQLKTEQENITAKVVLQ